MAILMDLLLDALQRMDRARKLLTDSKLGPNNNWGMLDTSDVRKTLIERLNASLPVVRRSAKPPHADGCQCSECLEWCLMHPEPNEPAQRHRGGKDDTLAQECKESVASSSPTLGSQLCAKAVELRDMEWMEVLHPGNADTEIGRWYRTPQEYQGYKHAEDCYQIEQNDWNGKLQDCLAKISTAMTGHDQAYYTSDEDTDGDNWRANMERFTSQVVALIQKRTAEEGQHTVDIVFDGPPGPVSGRFIEVESPPGTSIRFGKWLERADHRWVLRLPAAYELQAQNKELSEDIQAAILMMQQAKGYDWMCESHGPFKGHNGQCPCRKVGDDCVTKPLTTGENPWNIIRTLRNQLAEAATAPSQPAYTIHDAPTTDGVWYEEMPNGQWERRVVTWEERQSSSKANSPHYRQFVYIPYGKCGLSIDCKPGRWCQIAALPPTPTKPPEPEVSNAVADLANAFRGRVLSPAEVQHLTAVIKECATGYTAKEVTT